MKLYDLEQERNLLAGIIAHADFFISDLSHFISEKDFYSKDSILHKTLFLQISDLINNNKAVDISLVLHHINSLNLSFKDNISVPQYLESIDLLSSNISLDCLKDSAEIVKLLSIRRHFSSVGGSLQKTMSDMSSTSTYDDIISACDALYNESIELYENISGKAVNLFSVMPDLIYERANDRSIFKDSGPDGPHKSLNNLCGSLVRGGHITIICAGSGVGKTQFTTHYCMCVAGQHKIPILHLDNGEMSEEEIVFRMMASYSGVPLSLIESGDWADDSSYKPRVEKAIEKIQSNGIRYDYYNVGGKNIDEILTYISRYYYSEIGRGNPLIINFDYIKSSFEMTNKFKTEYQVVGEMVDKFKKLIQRDLVFNARPMVSLITSVQANRVGTVGNRSSEAVVDDESVISLSHRIKQFCSHLLILRNKTIDEMEADPFFCGRHILKIEKARNYGIDVARAQNLVEMPDGTHKKNYVNFEFDNFRIKDHGDLVDIVQASQNMNELELGNGAETLPI
jgi:replicative DNA helicase